MIIVPEAAPSDGRAQTVSERPGLRSAGDGTTEDRWGQVTCIVAGLVLALSTAACSGAPTAAPPSRPALETYAVGMLTDTFVDTSRPTAAWGPNPARPSRTLVTTVWYPATGRPGTLAQGAGRHPTGRVAPIR